MELAAAAGGGVGAAGSVPCPSPGNCCDTCKHHTREVRRDERVSCVLVSHLRYSDNGVAAPKRTHCKDAGCQARAGCQAVRLSRDTEEAPVQRSRSTRCCDPCTQQTPSAVPRSPCRVCRGRCCERDSRRSLSGRLAGRAGANAARHCPINKTNGEDERFRGGAGYLWSL
jgi:hypothetical protein